MADSARIVCRKLRDARVWSQRALGNNTLRKPLEESLTVVIMLDNDDVSVIVSI